LIPEPSMMMTSNAWAIFQPFMIVTDGQTAGTEPS
jgi:hypothetical protein